ncbi:uncharacterized protein LOC118738021 [Rhagoletis pomonella]|uniref:uncharacterized protein LOC118738021 n=1 Tax=Rhagoletis pomonella TaxID=28610 RepID=UPI0017835DEA|nr:uncharacterized protein LOC118738021 [Rhagoletis pomonella]
MELADAEKSILRRAQFESLAYEINIIKKKGSLPKSHRLYQLTPFIDTDSLLKVNGRIDAAYCLPITARRPVILPQKHDLTRLIVRYYHCQLHHQNDRLTVNEMRQKFWVTRALDLLKSVKRECPVCIYSTAKPSVPLMGQLPEDRLTPYVRPFSYAGVDYCGPFFVAIGRRREKRWVALFTCLKTRAVHLEVAPELSNDAFILCFRNFVNRRGVPIRIRSDNGTNFVGAQKILKNETQIFDFSRIEGEMTRRNIQWIFNCPANPSAGGCWERLIQCVKRLLQRVLKEEAPRLETFQSVLIEAENILNSRPLTELALTSQDEEPLTPNHFLLGCLNSTQMPSSVEERVCLRKQWRIAQNLNNRLWKRWTIEYLPQLLRRSKWRDEAEPLKPGQLVIVCDPTRPRSQWERGRVTEVFAAKDGQVRSAEVQTGSGLLRRPASKLAALTVSESSREFTGEWDVDLQH